MTAGQLSDGAHSLHRTCLCEAQPRDCLAASTTQCETAICCCPIALQAASSTASRLEACSLQQILVGEPSTELSMCDAVQISSVPAQESLQLEASTSWITHSDHPKFRYMLSDQALGCLEHALPVQQHRARSHAAHRQTPEPQRPCCEHRTSQSRRRVRAEVRLWECFSCMCTPCRLSEPSHAQAGVLQKLGRVLREKAGGDLQQIFQGTAKTREKFGVQPGRCCALTFCAVALHVRCRAALQPCMCRAWMS